MGILEGGIGEEVFGDVFVSCFVTFSYGLSAMGYSGSHIAGVLYLDMVIGMPLGGIWVSVFQGS